MDNAYTISRQLFGYFLTYRNYALGGVGGAAGVAFVLIQALSRKIAFAGVGVHYKHLGVFGIRFYPYIGADF